MPWEVSVSLTKNLYIEHFSEQTKEWSDLTEDQINTFITPIQRKYFDQNSYGLISLKKIRTRYKQKAMQVQYNFQVYSQNGRLQWPKT